MGLVLSRFMKDEAKGKIFWIANILAALAFAMGHLPWMVRLEQVAGISSLGFFPIFEIIILNGILGLAAGREYYRSGLIAAMTLHFSAALVWHILWRMFV